MWARRGDGQEFARLERKEKYENVPNCNRGRNGDHRFRARIQSTNPRAFSDSRNPLQMLNPWAPPRYGTWVESTSFDPNYPGKWKGIKLFEILF
jgi:hypothetical protein